MKKILLIDGHSILNRAFYGLPDMTNSKGQHTNAVLGFLNIMFKVIEEEQPTGLCVAFDVHQPTFRHLMYKEYKGTRKAMPDELREQVPLMKEVLQTMGVNVVEKGGYEADDIIGTLAKEGEAKGYRVAVISGDRDLLQLATDNIMVRIPKTKTGGTVVEDYLAKDVFDKYQVTPIEFIDLKGLMGDTADNIPGVPGIGEKTATKIITEYKSIENAYAHIEDIKPNKARENLQTYYDQAIFSKQLATIKLDCELDITVDAMDMSDMFNEKSYEMFKLLELKSILKKFDNIDKEISLDYDIISDFSEAELYVNSMCKEKLVGISLTLVEGEILAIGLSCKNITRVIISGGFLTTDYLCSYIDKLVSSDAILSMMDVKQYLPYMSICEEKHNVFDIGLAAYLLNPMKDSYTYDDISRDYLNILLPSKKELLGKSEITSMTVGMEVNVKIYAYEAYVSSMAYEVLINALDEKDMKSLYYDIELPTMYTLYDMQIRGIKVDRVKLKEYGDQLVDRISELEQNIHHMAGEEFNINSPKQLGEILFVKMEFPNGKKTKSGYSTSADILDKLKNYHPIVNDILEYRQLTKLKSTYADGLANYIGEDERIHGKFNQTITATGRISSTEPNLQNIPIRMPLGRLIRKVFIPEDGYIFVDADYSQIELRVLAHISNDPTLIDAFNTGKDIHAITASEVFGVPIAEVDSNMRRNAKAVNFGIVYGISAFGLSNDLNISRKEASQYIDKYFDTYKGVKTFLDEKVKEAYEEGQVKTLYGRVRPIPELSSSNFMQRNFGERVAMNSPIQGTAADIIKIAMIRVNKALKDRHMKSRMLLQIHDELLVETSMDEIEEVKEIMTKEMMGAADLLVPLSIDVNEGINWYEAK